MVRLPRAAVPLILFLMTPGAGATQAQASTVCKTGLLPPERATGPMRGISPDDLVRLRDIGSVNGYPERESPLAVSPGGHYAAFQVRRADPVANDYCLGMVVLEIKPASRPKLVDVGGEMIRITAANRNLQNFSSGEPKTIVPQWSPDARWIAYLRRDSGLTQVWRARVDGSRAEAVTHSHIDVTSFAWSRDGSAIVFTTQPELADKLARIEQEGRRGFVYDKQFWPVASARPFPRGPIATTTFAIELATGSVRVATKSEQALVAAAPKSASPANAISATTTPDNGRVAWTAPLRPEMYASPAGVHVRIDGVEQICEYELCKGSIPKLWWMKNQSTLLYLRYEGAAGRDELGLYRWSPGGRLPPTRLLQTKDMLVGCVPAAEKLLCGRETSAHPRRLVLIDPDTGRQQEIYDPNPEFGFLKLGTAQRLVWRNGFGAQTFGDLVLPSTHRAGDRHPLIIVQYRSRGFLRGGMGDEYPIFVLAEKGFAVLSIDRPADFADRLPLADVDSHTRANVADWADRKNVVSSVNSGIELLDKMGVIDTKRIGLTGMSDGASTAQFALVNSQRFAAAAVSSCCEDPSLSFSSIGQAYRDDLLRWGYPRLRDDKERFWSQFSLAMNADKIQAPILMQLSDDEFRFSLEAFEELRSRAKPVDLIVYPDEHHVKWQPAHRLSVYETAVQWFEFWLLSRVPQAERERTRWCQLAKDYPPQRSACSRPEAGDPRFDINEGK